MPASYSLLKMKKEALSFRSDNGLDAKTPINTKNLLVNLKVLTIFRPIQSDFSGMAIKSDNLKFMLINSNHSIGRQNYSILHELYHLIIQKDFSPMICYAESSNKKNPSDHDAELFASLVLLPEEGILDKIPKEELSKNKITLATIFEIEQFFMCSRLALLNRLQNMGLIDDNKRDEYKDNISLNAKLYGYDTSLYQKGNENIVIGDYAKLSKILFDKEVISESHFIDLMHDIFIDIEPGKTPLKND